MPCTACKELTHTKQTCPYLALRGERVFQTVVHELKSFEGSRDSDWNKSLRYEHAKKILDKLKEADLGLLAKRLEQQLIKNDAFMISANMYSANELLGVGIFGSRRTLQIRLGWLFSFTNFDVTVDETDHPGCYCSK